LGFKLDNARLLRAGLDYQEWAEIHEYSELDTCITAIKPTKLFAISTRGKYSYADAEYPDNVALLFGPESRGLPSTILNTMPTDSILRLPMRTHSRSLNLSNAVAVVVYEAWKQHDFQVL
jgi:tRNA (cytidine/uridine-2'-O-)-methyltransferase